MISSISEIRQVHRPLINIVIDIAVTPRSRTLISRGIIDHWSYIIRLVLNHLSMQELIEYDVRFSAIKISKLCATFLDRCLVRTVSVVVVQMKTSGTGRGTRTVTSAKRREIARFNFVRLLAEATGREDHPRGKELLGGTRVLVFFPPLLPPSLCEKEMRPSSLGKRKCAAKSTTVCQMQSGPSTRILSCIYL